MRIALCVFLVWGVAAVRLTASDVRPNILIAISDDQSYPHASAYDLLADRGELENTLVIVTSDNGMSFPRAKANLYEYGIHMPLAVCWPERVPGRRIVDDLVSLIDVTATIYEVSEVAPSTEHPLAGRSLAELLMSENEGQIDSERDAVYSGRERHSSARFNSLGYPQRCIRTRDYLYIHNFRPERWPAGAPQKYVTDSYADDDKNIHQRLGPNHGAYHDIDGCPTLSFLINNRTDPKIDRYLRLAVEKRPREELYAVGSDPGCLRNLADQADHQEVKAALADRLFAYLRKTNDARCVADDGGDVWETYPRFSGLRWFPRPDWAERFPERVPRQDWLEQRRPK